jgi:hypothetical protein
MSLFTRKTVLLAKIEATKGTDSAPGVSTDAMLIRNATLTPLEIDEVDRALMRNYLGASPQVVVGQHVGLDFEIEIAGAGTSAVTAPAFAPLLASCGFTSAINGATSWRFTPSSTFDNSNESCTMWVYIDSVLHKIKGAMGSVSFDFTVKQIPVMKFKFLGLYAAASISDASPSALTLTSWQTPLGVNNINTSGFTLHGISAVLQSLTIDMGNQLTYESLVGTGGEFVQQTDRKMVGSVTILANTFATKDWWSAALAATLGSLGLLHGTVGFNKFQITSTSTVQLMKPTYGDLNGMRTVQMGLQFVPTSAGNDEILIDTL